MGTVKPSLEEQRVLRNRAKAELERLQTVQSDREIVELLDCFKNKFNICETVYKVILNEHQKQRGKSTKGYLAVDMRQVPYALAFAGYSFDEELLIELFGSKSKKGKTVKKLRDAITHGFNEKAVQEIQRRQKELFGYMDAFVNIIETFDQVA